MKSILFAWLILSVAASAGTLDSITIRETSVERLGKDEFGATTVLQSRSGGFTARVTHPELGCVPILGYQPVEVTIRGFSFQSLVAAADVFTDTALTFFVRDEAGRRIGSISLSRSASQLVITAGFSRLPASFATEELVGELAGEPGLFSGIVGAHIVLGEFQVDRTIHVKGRQSVVRKPAGTDEFGQPLSISLHTVSGTGNADYTPPTGSIVSPRPGEKVETGLIDISGLARDNIGVSAVLSRLNGADLEPTLPTEAGQWTVSVGLTPGTNEFVMWAMDADGNYSATNTVRFFYSLTELLNLSWSGDGVVTGLTNRQPLELGRRYTMTARPAPTSRFGGWNGRWFTLDGGGPLQSSEASLSFIMLPTLALHASFIAPTVEPLTLEVTPENEVVGLTNAALLAIGQAYQALAKPGAGQIFLNWSGSLQSSNAAIRFIMQSNMVLQANFTANPWAPLAGQYHGLILEPLDDPSAVPLESGSFVLILTGDGRITGKLLLRKDSFPFTGRADLNGAAEIRVARPQCSGPLALRLQFDVDGTGGGYLNGSVSSPTIGSALVGNRSGGDATYAGRYTFRIFGPSGDYLPRGYGAGTAIVDTKGNATVAGVLGDGTPLAFSTVVYSNGFAPVYVQLYGGRGLLQGWLSFVTNGPPHHLDGMELVWHKPPVWTDRFYAGGFVTRATVLGARYTPPPTGVNALSWTDGVYELGSGNLPGVLSHSIRIVNNVTTVTDNLLRVRATLSPRTGLITVSFKHPITGRTASGKGVVVQFESPYEGFGYPVSSVGAGWFGGVSESGYFLLLPPSPMIDP